LLTIVAGLKPGAPGLRSILIEPHLGNLKHVNASMPTPSGTVTVDYTRKPDGIDADINLSDGLRGQLMWQGSNISVRGHQRLLLPVEAQ
jgi:hypothetical protein